MRGGDKTLMKAFGLELSSLRKAARLSQEELAYRAKVNRTYVAKLQTWRKPAHADKHAEFGRRIGEASARDDRERP